MLIVQVLYRYFGTDVSISGQVPWYWCLYFEAGIGIVVLVPVFRGWY